jgi:hypothetical protein
MAPYKRLSKLGSGSNAVDSSRIVVAAGRTSVGLDGDVLAVLAQPPVAALALHLLLEEAYFLTASGAHPCHGTT